MADLPELSESTKRKLALQWSTLLDEHGFTGEHLHWRERERERLRRVAAQVPSGRAEWRGERAADEAGILPSVEVAAARFQDLLKEYWPLWHSTGDGHEVFVAWLVILKRQVLGEAVSVWRGNSRAIDRWYKRACGPAIEEVLTDLQKEWTGRARAEEGERLARGATAKAVNEANRSRPIPKSLKRASWLNHRLRERGWSTSDPYRQRGPDRKTVERILRGKAVRNDTLEKLADALSRKHGKVSVLDIPED